MTAHLMTILEKSSLNEEFHEEDHHESMVHLGQLRLTQVNWLDQQVKCKYVKRNMGKGRKNEESAGCYEGLRRNTYDSDTPYPFDYCVTLSFGSIASGLDPVSPAIRLPIERGINSGTRIGAMAGADINTLTMEQYLTLSRENQAPGMVKPEIGGSVNFEIKSQFM
ncbi:hypothetical protein Tco_0162171 [Tanacetum coccineum]